MCAAICTIGFATAVAPAGESIDLDERSIVFLAQTPGDTGLTVFEFKPGVSGPVAFPGEMWSPGQGVFAGGEMTPYRFANGFFLRKRPGRSKYATFPVYDIYSGRVRQVELSPEGQTSQQTFNLLEAFQKGVLESELGDAFRFREEGEEISDLRFFPSEMYMPALLGGAGDVADSLALGDDAFGDVLIFAGGRDGEIALVRADGPETAGSLFGKGEPLFTELTAENPKLAFDAIIGGSRSTPELNEAFGLQARDAASDPLVWYVDKPGGEPIVVNPTTGEIARPFSEIALSDTIPFARAEQIIAGRQSLAVLCSSERGGSVEVYGLFPDGEVVALSQDNPLFEAPFGVMTNPLATDDFRAGSQGDVIVVALSNGGRPESVPGVIVQFDTAGASEPQVIAQGGDEFINPLAITSVRALVEVQTACNGADFNNDGVVDGADFGVFGAAFGASTGDLGYDAQADFNDDGVVDGADFGAFANEFGRTDCPG